MSAKKKATKAKRQATTKTIAVRSLQRHLVGGNARLRKDASSLLREAADAIDANEDDDIVDGLLLDSFYAFRGARAVRNLIYDVSQGEILP